MIQLQPQDFLNLTQQVWHTRLSFLSSSNRLGGKCRCTRTLQRCSIGFRSGPLKDIHRVTLEPLLWYLGCVLWVIGRFSSRISLYIAAFLFLSILRVLGHLPLPQQLSLDGWPALGRVLLVTNFFPLQIREDSVLIGTVTAAEIALYLSPDLRLQTILSQKSTENSFDFRLGLYSKVRCQLRGLI